MAPTPEQEITLGQFAGVARFVYNLCLEQRIEWRRQYRAATGDSLNFVSQGRQVTQLRAEFDWIKAVPSCALTQALRDLDNAYSSFFAGRTGYPDFRRKGENESFRIQAKELNWRTINRRWGEVRVPNLGWVKFKLSRPIVGNVKNATFIRDALGWHVSFLAEIAHEAPANDNPPIGIDRGVTISLALSNGEVFQLPDLAAIERRRRRAQRVLARRKRGSNRRRKQLALVARLSAKIARIRADWQHKASRSIADRFGTVVLEDLKVVNMARGGHSAQKRGLNRSIMNQGWGGFEAKLAYKLEARGGALVKVPAHYSSQTCSDCGAVDSESRKSQASFVCTSCGFRANSDHNAAIVILRRSAPTVEGAGYGPAEAETCLRAA